MVIMSWWEVVVVDMDGVVVSSLPVVMVVMISGIMVVIHFGKLS